MCSRLEEMLFTYNDFALIDWVAHFFLLLYTVCIITTKYFHIRTPSFQDFKHLVFYTVTTRKAIYLHYTSKACLRYLEIFCCFRLFWYFFLFLFFFFFVFYLTVSFAFSFLSGNDYKAIKKNLTGKTHLTSICYHFKPITLFLFTV